MECNEIQPPKYYQLNCLPANKRLDCFPIRQQHALVVYKVANELNARLQKNTSENKTITTRTRCNSAPVGQTLLRQISPE